jgi:hypothetical protein
MVAFRYSKIMLQTIRKDWAAQFTTVFLFFLTLWWILINTGLIKGDEYRYYFGAIYGVIAIWGGVWGIVIAKKWGWTKSVMGKAILALSLGLLLQEFGQIIFSYYNIFLHVEIPYPSIADFGFFGTIPLYIAGITWLAKASGVQFSLKKISSRLQLVILPIIMLSLSYFFFLRTYEFDLTNPLRVFLDFGYPLGQAIYVSIALLTYSLSKELLGGIMKNKILFLLLAFIAQYFADYNFLYQTLNETWINGGYGDYLYLIAYFLMALGIIQLKGVLDALRLKPNTTQQV